jgi:hypothetical protein
MRVAALLLLAASLGCACSVPQISLVAATDTAGWAHDVVLEGSRLYLSDRQGGFLVFSHSPEWKEAARFIPVSDVISLAPHSGEPLLASRFEGLVLVGADGRVKARLSNGDIANSVATRGDLAFAAYGLHGLVIVRISEDNLKVVGELATPGWSHDVQLSGDQALLADWKYGLRVVDIHNPETPTEVGVLPSEATTIHVAVRQSGGTRIAAIADGHGGIAFAELTPSGCPRLLGRIGLGLNPSDEPHPESGGWVHSVAWAGHYVAAANWKRGLALLDAQDPRNPRLICEIPAGGTALGVTTEPQPDGSWLVFLADGEAGLKVYRLIE